MKLNFLIKFYIRKKLCSTKKILGEVGHFYIQTFKVEQKYL